MDNINIKYCILYENNINKEKNECRQEVPL